MCKRYFGYLHPQFPYPLLSDPPRAQLSVSFKREIERIKKIIYSFEQSQLSLFQSVYHSNLKFGPMKQFSPRKKVKFTRTGS